MSHEVVVKELCVFPVKGCQGTYLEEATITRAGVAGDHLFTLVYEGEPLDQTRSPQLGGIGVTWDEENGLLSLSHPEKGQYVHERRESGGELPMKIVLDHAVGVDQGDEVASWLERVVGREVRLATAAKSWNINLPLPQFDRLHGTEKSRFYPVSPVSLSNVASLDDLNGRLKTPVPMNRFRMNMVVEGLEAWDENRIDTLSSPDLELENVTVCERCIIITTDQETGERKKSDLLQTLNKFQRREKGERFGSGLVFGAYMGVAKEGNVRVGDRLTVEFKASE